MNNNYKKIGAASQSTQLQATVNSSITERLATASGIQKDVYINTIKLMCFPQGNATNEQFAAFLLVCEKYNLNPLTKEIWAFPTKIGGIMPMVGYQGWSNLVNAQKSYDGMEIITNVGDDGKPIKATCTMYRKDRTHPTIKTVWFFEWYKNTPNWNAQPIHMLEIRAFIQAARLCFGLTGLYDEDAPVIDIPATDYVIDNKMQQQAHNSPITITEDKAPAQVEEQPLFTVPPGVTPANEAIQSDLI